MSKAAAGSMRNEAPEKIKPVIGIDLGTTNSALAFTSGDAVEVFPVAQFVHPGEIREELLLPSFLFLEDREPIVGVLAQRKGLENASRLVSSAKSWLSYSGVDRTAAILPIHAKEGIPRVSPVEASRLYLAHLRSAWNQKHPRNSFDKHQILITVPASFDAVARELTVRAAEQAEYRDVILLEEPQAAFYNWIERNPGWREQVNVGDLILVIDIGGGTTDFSLIAVREQAGEITLERIAVGEHILLGGDNIDAALAYSVSQSLRQKLDTMQFHALLQQTRAAKEALLREDAKEAAHPITILGRGTGVVGGTVKTKLERSSLHQILLDGFLPETKLADEPAVNPGGLSEVGLPYAADPAITRHLAHFLHQQKASPTHVLFNGGVLRAALVRDRILHVLNRWLEKPVTPLVSDDLMHAVARGAAYYGLARQGKGVRVRGGVPRTYYIGVETSMLAVPGMKPPLKLLTVAPFGMEEGSSVQIADRQFSLRISQSAQFRFFQSSARKTDRAGEMLEEIPSDVEEVPPVEITLAGQSGASVAVTLESLVTETGMLQLWFVARDGRRWKLEFSVRSRR